MMQDWGEVVRSIAALAHRLPLVLEPEMNIVSGNLIEVLSSEGGEGEGNTPNLDTARRHVQFFG